MLLYSLVLQAEVENKLLMKGKRTKIYATESVWCYTMWETRNPWSFKRQHQKIFAFAIEIQIGKAVTERESIFCFIMVLRDASPRLWLSVCFITTFVNLLGLFQKETTQQYRCLYVVQFASTKPHSCFQKHVSESQCTLCLSYCVFMSSETGFFVILTACSVPRRHSVKEEE